MAVFIAIEVFYLLYAGVCTMYLCLFAIAGNVCNEKKRSLQKKGMQYKIAVLIPAYKEDSVIIETAKQALQQSYSSKLYDVIVISDSLSESTLKQLRILPIKLISITFKKSTKSKAINAALQQLPDYNIALVLDADNVMEYRFLEKVVQAFENGYSVVQGHRTAKNINTSVAIMDAISEEINNYIFRKGHCAIGLSSALIGSAMAFEYSYFKNKMSTIKAISGFDKELELAILKDKQYIYYLEDALVYDEKVQRVADFRRQRTRWIAAQLNFVYTYFISGIRLLFKGNIDYFDKVVQFLLLPRLILLGSLSINLLLLSLLMQYSLFNINLLIFTVLVFSLIIAAPKYLLNKLSWRELLQLPNLFIHFILSFLQYKKARQNFLHTPHGEVNNRN